MTKFLLLTLLLIPQPALAYGSQRGYSNQCFREVYREEYVPGTRRRPGYVRRWTDTKEVPCRSNRPRYTPRHQSRPQQDENSCLEGAILGGILGGGLGGAISRGDGRYVGVPTGIVAGALLGCQIDGG